MVDKPIAIQSLKRVAADIGLEDRPEPIERTKEERVAIVGSGPAGLTAAYDLVRMGYGVKVYEALPIPGGMLTAGIPEFNLPKEVAMAEIDYIRKLGVDIRTSFALGKDFSLENLWDLGYKAVLLALGSQKSAELAIPGADLEGVHQALPLLKRVRLGESIEFTGTVAVIGGGNVAMDAARTALRLGAQEVHVTCLESRSDMPAFSWEIDATVEEGAKLHPALAPQQFKAGDGGRVAAIDFQRVASTRLDKDGRITWTLKEGPGSQYSMEVDAVIVAIGQMPDVPSNGDINVTPKGTLDVRTDSMALQLPGVFGAGDATVGVGTLVQAIADGHRAAEAIDHYLRGEMLPSQPDLSKEVVEADPETVPDFLIRKSRWNVPSLAPQDATRCFREVKLGYPVWEAKEEAKRCLNCKMCVNCIFEREQLCFECAMRLL
jgi:NADPH-dependent glutamate synthase beta subunit-like oxidoreductase